MKQQVLAQKTSVFVFTALFFIYIMHAVAYAGLEFTEGEKTTREVAENTAAGINIGEPLRYSSEGVNSNCFGFRIRGPDAKSFNIGRAFRGVQLKTMSALDYETKSSYKVRLTVSGGGCSDTIDVTIIVTDVDEIQPNRPPVFDSDSTTRAIVENTPADRNIGPPVSATDSDDDTLSYSLSGNPDAASFNIDPSSGQLKTKAALDHETKPQYMVTVEVSDGKGGTDTINVTINITTVDRPEALISALQNGVEVQDQTVTINPFKLIVVFDEPVTGFEQSDLSFDDFNTDSTITGWEMSADGKQYTATVEPQASGGVTFTVPENVAQAADDSQGNVSTTLLVLVVDVPGSPASVGSKSTPNPDETVLLANYPNPFNPETWIPYRLAKSADVEVTIYNAHGTVVRHLELGHQYAGYYTSRNHAAYWDGKNDFGERVASGIYFYQLQADTISPLRKMVTLK